MLHAVSLLTLLCLAPAGPQDAGDTQIWQGAMDIGQATVTLQIRATRTADGWKAVFRAVTPPGPEFDAESFTVQGKAVEISIPRIMATYSGKLNAAGDAIEGVWKQAGQEFPLQLRLTMTAPDPTPVEVWKGEITAGERTLELQFRVFEDADGKRTAVFDSLTENVRGLPAQYASANGRLTLSVDLLKAKFEGQLNESGDAADGKWIQGGQIPATFTRTADYTEPEPPRRPQTPTEPFRYRVNEVTFENKQDGVTLAGTLTLPRSAGRHAAAVLISGSGPQDRDETIYGHKPFLVIAHELTNAGIAVLRFDDRGVGQSTGNFGTATSEDFADDVRAAVAFLRKHPDVDPNRVGLIGHSEGGLIAPMVAATDKKLAFAVLLAGPGVTGLEILRDQSQRIAKAEKLPPALIERDMQLREAIVAAVLSAKPDADGGAVVEKAIADFIRALPEDQRASAAPNDLQLQQYKQLGTPWFRFFLTYDPATNLRKVQCPILAVNGEKDLQVWHEINLPAIVNALRAGGNDSFRAVRLPSLNHLFQRAGSGAVSEYNEIEQTIAPEVLDLMRSWVLKVTRQ